MHKLIGVSLILCLQLILIKSIYAFDCQNKQQLSSVLNLAKIQWNQSALVSCKKHPENAQQTIIAYAYPIIVQDEPSDYQLNFLVPVAFVEHCV